MNFNLKYLINLTLCVGLISNLAACVKQMPAEVIHNGMPYQFKEYFYVEPKNSEIKKEIEPHKEVLEIKEESSNNQIAYSIDTPGSTTALSKSERAKREEPANLNDVLGVGGGFHQKDNSPVPPAVKDSLAEIALASKPKTEVTATTVTVIKSSFIMPVEDARMLRNLDQTVSIPIRTPGSDVFAIAEGKVLYAGGDLKKYGNLVILEHKGGWVSTYANLSKIDPVIKADAIVKSGGVIGHINSDNSKKTSTSNKNSGKLVFSLRKDGKVIDPLTVY